MKRHIRALSLTLAAILVLSLSAGAAHEKTTWKTLNDAKTCIEPYKDYESVFDKTEQNYLFSEYEKDLFALQAKFPDRMRLEIMGYSELGRPLYVVILGKNSAPNRTFVLSGTHAREYMTAQLSVLQIEFYLQNYYNTMDGERICDLLERCQFYFVPMFNPDGAQLAMIGLDSLDAPEVTIDATEKAKIEKFLISQLMPMHKTCEEDKLHHDTDADPYTKNPDPERDDAFIYWKSNIRGVDLSNSMYDPEMKQIWVRQNRTLSAHKRYSTPAWQAHLGSGATTDGIALSAENSALCEYVGKIKPNIFLSYHTMQGILMWDYDYSVLGGDAARKNAMKISYKAGELLNYPLKEDSQMLMGHQCWFMKESLEYMTMPGYGAVIEWGNRAYLQKVGDYGADYIDAPPTKIGQLTEDVSTNSGTERYSLWTTGKFFPLSLSQYIVDNSLIQPVAPLTVTPGTPVTPVTPPAADLPFTDLTRGETFYENISWVFEKGLMNGKTATTFDRKSNLTRQQVWRVMVRAVTGSDVADMAAAKAWAVSNGIADGTLPGADASRQEVVTMMWKAFGKANADTSKLDTYKDAASVSAEAKTAMAWAIENGVISGYDDNTLRPAANITRGAFSAILHRYLDK